MGIDKKQHAQAIEDIDSRLSLEDHRDLNNILIKTRLNLAAALDDPDFLLIDKQDSIDSLQNIETKLGDETTTNSLLYNIKDRIDQINDIINKASTTTGGTKKGIDTTSFHREIMELNKLKANINTNRTTRHAEYKKLADSSRFFEDTIKNKAFELSRDPIKLNAGTGIAGTSKKLDDVFFGSTRPDKKDVSMQLCDAHGEPFKEDKSGNPILEMVDNQGNTHEVILENNTTPPKPFFDKKNHKINWSSLIIKDIKTNKEITYDDFDFSKAMSLGTLTKVDAGGIKVANMKSFSIKLDTENVSKKMTFDRQITEFDSTATSTAWPVYQNLKDEYSRSLKSLEKDALADMIDASFSDPTEKEEALKNLLASNVNGRPLSPLIHDLDELKDGFKLYFFSSVRKPTEQELTSPATYNTYLRTVIPTAIKEYLKTEIHRQLHSISDVRESQDLNNTSIQLPSTRNIYDAVFQNIPTIQQDILDKKFDLSKQITEFDLQLPHIGSILSNTYTNTYRKEENNALSTMLASSFPDETERKEAIKQICSLIVNTRTVSPLIYNLNELKDGFKLYFFNKVNKPTEEQLKSPVAYNTYIRESLPQAIKDYLTTEIHRQLHSISNTPETEILDGTTISKPSTRNIYGPISAKIFEIKNNSEANRKDDDTAKNNLTTGINGIGSPIKTHTSLFGLLKQSDISYMKYLTKQSVDIPEQKIPVEVDNTNNAIENKTYSGKFSIDNKGTNIFTIDIENGENFTLKATDHVTLIKQILKDPRIPYDKMKVHVAYSICKSLIQCTQQAGIPLEKMEAGKFSRIKLDKNNSIVFEEFDDSTGTRKKTSLFSEADALKKGDMGLVQQGIEKVLKQFDDILSNRISNQNGALKSKLLKTDFPTSWAGSPFKKLRNMGKNKMDFGFNDFQIPDIDRDIKVSLHNNLFTIHVDGIDQDIVGKDLGQILVKNKIFSGMEHKITGAIYKKLITNTAKYPRFGNKKFFVKDTHTDRAYMIDKDGDISYVTLNDPLTLAALSGKKKYGIVNDKNNPLTQTVLNESESQGFYENVPLSAQLLKAMMTAL